MLGTPLSPLPKAKWYYAVARGRIPGVYTDWGQAERKVNGYSGAIHKKFQDQRQAKKFIRDNQQSDDESKGGRSESSGTKASVRE
jgi:ribonuclease HI